MGLLEQSLSCTGWCNLGSNQPLGWIYRFSDINNGKPQGYCYDMAKDAVYSYGNVIGIGAFITAAFLLIVMMVNVYLCFHESRKSLGWK